MSSMPRWLHALAIVALTVVVFAAGAHAQDRGRDDDDRDRGRGDSGGFRGPPFGGGGFPGGGFPGGGFPGGGFSGRGPFGGSPFGGSSPGGSSSGSSGFLRSMDANGNGVIEPSEVSDRSRSFLERMAREAGLDMNRPIPISRLEEAMRRRSSGSSGSSSSSSSRGSSSGSATMSLVPGFGPDETLPPVLGFGGTDPGLWVSPTGNPPAAISDRAREEARDSIRRYDRNNDNILDAQEARNGRFSDDPLKYDKNGDGRLTQEELAQRYADRRAADDDDDDRRRGDSRGGSSSPFSRFSGGGPGGPFGGFSGGPGGGGGPFGGSFRGGPSSGGSPFGGSSFSRGGPPGGSSFGRGGSSGGDSDRTSMIAGMMLSRYDRNSNGSIDGDEIDGLSERFDIRTLDGNNDRRISREELASNMSSASRSPSGGGPGGGGLPSFRGGDGDRGDGSRFSSRGSDGSRSGRDERSSDSGRNNSNSASASDQPSRFLTAHERLPEDIPSWFRDKDANGDGQIGMNEYAASWSDSTAVEFMRYDANSDGVLVPDEVLAGPSDSHLPGNVAASSSGTPSFAGSSSSFSLVTRSSTAPAASTANLSEKYKKYAEGQIKMYDKNADGFLEPSEWSKMLKKPDAADTDGDGKVSVDELGAFLQSQYTKK